MAVGKYPTFQDKYGQLAPQDPTYEQNKSPEMAPAQPQAPQEKPNPWAAIQKPDVQMEPQQVELAPRQWEYTGK